MNFPPQSSSARNLQTLLLAAGVAICVATPGYCGAKTCNELQQNFSMSGEHKLSLWPDAMRCEVSRMGYNLEYTQKDKVVTIWRPAEKKYAKVDFQKFNRIFRNIAASASWLSELPTQKPLSQAATKVDGVAVTEYTFQVKTSASFWRSDIGRKDQFKKIKVTIDYIDLPGPDNASTIVAKLYELPLLKGFPWQLRHMHPDTNKLVRPFRTIDHIKSDKKFVAFNPRGYKLVDFTTQLTSPVLNEDAASIFLP